ncbi:MAG: hypothetical protein FWC39_14255 [Bacteroidetes bacterium]|nr:hypothetical protein [Bacteroidota bacterium]
MNNFNSQLWVLPIKNLAEAYFNKADKNFISFNKNFFDVFEERYNTRLCALKREIYGENDITANKIDRHKIIALYIQLFLEFPIFILPKNIKTEQLPTPNTMLINELFCLDFMQTILNCWNSKKFNTKKFEEYKHSLIKLFSEYMYYSDFHKNTSFHTYALAHIVYFTEDKYCL